MLLSHGYLATITNPVKMGDLARFLIESASGRNSLPELFWCYERKSPRQTAGEFMVGDNDSMTGSTAKTIVRILSFLPGACGALALLLAVMFCVWVFEEFVWWHLALGIALGCYAVYLFRFVYLSWRRPSSEIVRDVCGWTAFALLALCSLAVEQL